MKTAELILNLLRGVVALLLFCAGALVEIGAWCCHQIGERCFRAAEWVIGD